MFRRVFNHFTLNFSYSLLSQVYFTRILHYIQQIVFWLPFIPEKYSVGSN
jgi:hypothetical protein